MEKDDILATAMKEFEADHEYWREEYERGQEDIAFSLGDQWPSNIKAAREKDGRPCLTENRIDVSILQVVNDIRQTRPAINVAPCDDKGDIETARVLKGIIRNIEQVSNANNAYDTAAENAVRGSLGWLRVNTQYVDEYSFDQEAVIEGIQNPWSVMIDRNIKKLDGSDARHGFVFTDVPEDEFRDTYPDAQPISFDSELEAKGWCSSGDKTVRIAEYFYKEETPVTLVQTSLGVMPEDEAKEKGIPTGDLPRRKSKKCKVKWVKFNQNEILEETEWLGKYIPLVPVFGKVVWVDGRRKSFSLTHQGKDPQTRFNFHITAETEWTALQPKAPWIAYEDQLTPDQYKAFAESNVKNHAVLTHKLTYDKAGNPLPPPQRQAAPTGAPALMQQAMIAADGIKATLGIFDASLGAKGNETSGKAILARQAEGDNATFHFVDNLATAIRHVGRILVDIIPKLYSGPTIARILGEDNEPQMVPVNQPVVKMGKKFMLPNQGQGQPYTIALDAGKYDVSVSIGPSYATKRQEMTQNMFELYKMAPQLLEVSGDIFFRNLDWDGAQELAERAKKVLPPQFQDESPEQAQLMQAQQQIQAMAQQLQQMDAALKQKQDNQAFQNEIEARKTDADIAKMREDIEIEKQKLALEWAKLGQTVTPEQVQAVFGAIQEMDANLKDVGQAVAMILDEAEQSLIPEIPQGTVPAEL